jgi:protein gp37
LPQSKIEWLKSADGKPGYSINPVKGLCPMACDYCYARRMYKRFKWNPEIRFDDQALFGLPKEPARIFVGSTMELFGSWVKPNWWDFIIQTVALLPQHTFIFLTKCPADLPKKWPDNCWVGVSVPMPNAFGTAIECLRQIQAPVKFLSIEPLLKRFEYDAGRIEYYLKLASINWLIIGQQTPVKAATAPKVSWIKEIMEAADSAGIPVFLKDNLRDLLPGESPFYSLYQKDDFTTGYLRQEFPK